MAQTTQDSCSNVPFCHFVEHRTSPRQQDGTLSSVYSSLCRCLSSGPSSRHKRPMVALISHTPKLGFLAFTVCHICTSHNTSDLTELRLYFLLDTKQVILEMILSANLLASTHTHSHLTALCPGLPGWGKAFTPHTRNVLWASVIILDFMRRR